MDSTIKAAKKILKKDEKGSIKVKQLVKSVMEKLGDKDVTSGQVKDWILGSDKFSLEGKLVSLKSSKKRKQMSEGSSANDEKDEKAKKKAAKRAKKEAKKEKKTKGVSSSSSDGSVSGEGATAEYASKWRTDNKVVLKVTQENDDDGKAESEKLNSNEVYFPYSSFSSPKCKENINEVLLRQCTEVNGFKKPSAIQAQCWPVMLHSDNGKTRDIVG